MWNLPWRWMTWKSFQRFMFTWIKVIKSGGKNWSAWTRTLHLKLFLGVQITNLNEIVKTQEVMCTWSRYGVIWNTLRYCIYTSFYSSFKGALPRLKLNFSFILYVVWNAPFIISSQTLKVSGQVLWEIKISQFYVILNRLFRSFC